VGCSSGIELATIDTLVEDIEKVLTEHHEFSEDRIQELGQRIANSLKESLGGSSEREEGTLRFSNIGMPCDRKLWYTVNTPKDAEPLPPEARLKFAYGHILEELLLFLAEEAGHEVTGRQDELEIEGVKGHRDAVIDGVLVDVKSASTYSFQKFKSNGLRSSDPFGYLPQINSYREASNEEVDQSKAAFLVVDKTLGHICLDVYEADGKDYTEVIREKKEIISGNTPPRGFPPVPDGKSGNKMLGAECSYCEFKRKCWPELRTFLYSNGPRYLTKVVREPNVPEVDSEGKIITNENF